MSIEILKAISEDISTILSFMEDYYGIERKAFDRQKSTASIEFLLNHQDIGSIWIISKDKQKIGYFCLAYNFSLDIGGRDCFLDEIYIKGEYRGMGVGDIVIDKIVEYLESLDFRGIHLLVYDFNEYATAFYIKKGFSVENGKFMTFDLHRR